MSTTLPAPIGATAVGASLVPEATADYEFKQQTINGIAYSNALRIYSSTTPKKVEINAGRSYKRFIGSLGVPDDQKSASVHQVEITVDGGPAVFSDVVKFGETKDFDIDITNALRVRVTVLSKGGSDLSGYVAIGNPRFT